MNVRTEESELFLARNEEIKGEQVPTPPYITAFEERYWERIRANAIRRLRAADSCKWCRGSGWVIRLVDMEPAAERCECKGAKRR